jgi:predicted SAM-dependent methyltransferase
VYRLIKKYFKLIIPRKFLFKNELFFRYWYGIFYLGNNHQCNICEKKLRSFVLLENDDLLCPFCGSLSRNRRLWALLNENRTLKGNILHFSPSRSLYRKLKTHKNLNYVSSDYENEFLADYKYDITNINQPKEKFDVIICYHILEHIIEDKKAMLELYRILKPKGCIFIQTPFKEGEIHEDNSIVMPSERLQYFGQEDHVRVYSIEGLKTRLEKAGFRVKISTFYENDSDFKYGFKFPETILMVTKI